jgi:cell division protein FtsI/penicillin-binding protein 2
VNPTRGGIEASLAKAIARSYNQCFAQLAVHALGEQPLLQAFRRFGWQESPAAGHEPGAIERGEGDYDLGKLGSGLAGSRITVLHAAQLAATLAEGNLIEPWWIDRIVDAEGRSLGLPRRGVRRSVMKRAVADELRSLLVGTTTRGTARSAFRNRRGRPRLDDVRVAGKTGNLSGRDPRGRYEWFAGVAPADDPRIAVAVLQLHDRLWWRTSAQIAGDVFGEVFCERSRCSEERAARFTGDLRSGTAPLLLMDPSPAEER